METTIRYTPAFEARFLRALFAEGEILAPTDGDMLPGDVIGTTPQPDGSWLEHLTPRVELGEGYYRVRCLYRHAWPTGARTEPYGGHSSTYSHLMLANAAADDEIAYHARHN